MTQSKRFSFSLRGLLVAVLISAIGIFATQYYFVIANSKPIDIAVDLFNKKELEQYNHVVGDGKPPLTSAQIIERLNSDEEIIKAAPPQVAAILRQILKTRRIPNDIRFELNGLWSSNSSSPEAWIVTMEIMRKDARYGINIREIEPFAGPVITNGKVFPAR